MKNLAIRHYTFIIVTISLLLLSACAGLAPSFEKPKVNLADIQVREIKTLETAFLVQLRIMNPNETPLEIQGLSCDVELDGRQFASGLQGEQLTVPPYGTALVPVDVYASVLDMVSSVIGLIQTAGKPDSQLESVNYRLTGRVRVSTGSFSRSIPFESEGELKLK
jgi:LEA14-like dessication related protein